MNFLNLYRVPPHILPLLPAPRRRSQRPAETGPARCPIARAAAIEILG